MIDDVIYLLSRPICQESLTIFHLGLVLNQANLLRARFMSDENILALLIRRIQPETVY